MVCWELYLDENCEFVRNFPLISFEICWELFSRMKMLISWELFLNENVDICWELFHDENVEICWELFDAENDETCWELSMMKTVIILIR
jgi:hypothetical protein